MKTSIHRSIKQKLRLINSKNFNSDDIKLLYVDLRDYAGKNTITREVGDFIAHPEEKNRGITHKRVKDQYSEFIKMADLLSGRRPGESHKIKVKSAFNSTAIINDLVNELKRIGFKKIHFIHELKSAIELCVFAILQDAVIAVDNKKINTAISFQDSVISLSANYEIDYKGRKQILSASIIEGSYSSNEIGRGSKSLIPGNIFVAIVSDGKPRMEFID